MSVLICTYGAPAWAELACERAYPSAERQDPYEIVVEHDDEMYLDEVRNAAAAKATGDLLVFLDADDELAPGYLAAMAAAAAPYEEGDLVEGGPWLVGRRDMVGGDGRQLGAVWPPLFVPAVSYVQLPRFVTAPAIPQLGRWPKLNECVIGTGVPRDLFFAVGGFRALPSLEDYDLWLRCYDAGARLVYVPDAVYRAFVRSAGRNADQSPYASIWADHLARIAA